jgi:hypothetical protein
MDACQLRRNSKITIKSIKFGGTGPGNGIAIPNGNVGEFPARGFFENCVQALNCPQYLLSGN